jgi:putative phosphoribosyl transferase
MPTPLFPDRASAGRTLGAELVKRRLEDPVVFALPRGGVPVAAEVAKALSAPLDLLLVRKIGAPGQPELAVASIVDGERPDIVLNEDIVRALRISQADLSAAAALELKEIERRRALYLPGRTPLSAAARTAIIVDDGIATGASIKSAILAVRRRGPKRVVVAVPVAPADAIVALKSLADEVVCLEAPEPFWAVGSHYRDFHQLSDEEVTALLAQSSPALLRALATNA